MTTGKRVYIAGKIDGVVDDKGMERIRQRISDSLTPYGHSTYDPYKAFSYGGVVSHANWVVNTNRTALAQCDVMVVYLVGEIGWGFGTIREIEAAKSLGKRVIILLGDNDKLESLEAQDLEVDTLFRFFDKHTNGVDPLAGGGE